MLDIYNPDQISKTIHGTFNYRFRKIPQRKLEFRFKMCPQSVQSQLWKLPPPSKRRGCPKQKGNKYKPKLDTAVPDRAR